MIDPAEALKGDQMEVKKELDDREFIAWCRSNWERICGVDAVRINALLGKDYGRRMSRDISCDLAELRLDLAEAREDTARLEFMFGDPENGASHDQLKNVWENAVTLHGARAEIDAARGKA